MSDTDKRRILNPLNARAGGDMAEGPKHDNQAQHSTAPEEEQHSTPSHTRYVRPRTPHRTVEPVNDLEQDDALAEVTHESDFTVGTLNPLAGRGYRRSRNNMNRISRDLHYGQYLSIPKGRRAIFASREHKRKVKSIVSLVVLVVMLAIVAVIVWQLISNV